MNSQDTTCAPTVFVVDDDPDMRDSLQMLIETLGYDVRVFEAAEAFSRFYDGDRPGCLVLDIRMPGQTGLELYEELLRSGRRIPAIFITAHADVSTAVAAMKTGAIEFLEKPFDGSRLLELLVRAIEFDADWRAQRNRVRRAGCQDRDAVATGPGNARTCAGGRVEQGDRGPAGSDGAGGRDAAGPADAEAGRQFDRGAGGSGRDASCAL